MNIRFYRDPDTDEPRIYGHDVDEDEVADVLESPGEDRPGREGSRIALGKSTRRGSTTTFVRSWMIFAENSSGAAASTSDSSRAGP